MNLLHHPWPRITAIIYNTHLNPCHQAQEQILTEKFYESGQIEENAVPSTVKILNGMCSNIQLLRVQLYFRNIQKSPAF